MDFYCQLVSPDLLILILILPSCITRLDKLFVGSLPSFSIHTVALYLSWLQIKASSVSLCLEKRDYGSDSLTPWDVDGLQRPSFEAGLGSQGRVRTMGSSQNLLGGSSVFCATTIHKASVLPEASVLGFSYMAPVRLLSWTPCGSQPECHHCGDPIPSNTLLLHMASVTPGTTPTSLVTALSLHLHSPPRLYCSLCTQDTLIRCFLALILCHMSQPPLLLFLHHVSGKGKEG